MVLCVGYSHHYDTRIVHRMHSLTPNGSDTVTVNSLATQVLGVVGIPSMKSAGGISSYDQLRDCHNG